jgi:hypothetical protein
MSLLYNTYLFNCDYVYKNKLTSRHSIPKIDTLDMSVSINNLTKELDTFLNASHSSDAQIQMNTFLLIYLNYAMIPYVSYVNSSKKKDFFCKVVLKKKEALHFLFKHFYDVYAEFINHQLQISTKNTKFIFFESNFLNSRSLQYYIKEIFGAAGLKNLNFYMNIKLKKIC